MTLDGASVEILSGILRGDPGICLASTHNTGGGLPTIAPFCHIPSEEIALYARIHGLEGGSPLETEDDDSLRADVKRLLDEYTSRHPAAPHAVLNLCDSLREEVQVTHGKESHPGTEQLMMKRR